MAEVTSGSVFAVDRRRRATWYSCVRGGPCDPGTPLARLIEQISQAGEDGDLPSERGDARQLKPAVERMKACTCFGARAHSRGIDERHLGEIEDDVSVPAVDERVQDIAQVWRGADIELATALDNGRVVLADRQPEASRLDRRAGGWSTSSGLSAMATQFVYCSGAHRSKGGTARHYRTFVRAGSNIEPTNRRRGGRSLRARSGVMWTVSLCSCDRRRAGVGAHDR
jgi:hypothetical protein